MTTASMPPVAATALAPHLTLHVVDSLAGLEQLRNDWNALLALHTNSHLFLTPAWNIAWWRAFGAGHTLRTLTLRDKGQLVALWPLAIYKSRMAGLPAKVLGTFSNAHTSRTDMVVAPGMGALAAQHFAHYFKTSSSEWDAIHLQQMPAQSAHLEHLQNAARQAGLHQLSLGAGISKYRLPIDGNWESYLVLRGTHFRRNIGKTERRLERGGAVDYRHTHSPVDPASDFATFADVEARSWKGDDQEAARLGADGWRFQREFASQYQDGISCDNTVVSIDGKPMAIVHTVAYQGVSYCFQTLYDETAKDLYIGRAAVTRHFEQLFNKGHLTAIDLNGDSAFCKSWGPEEQTFVSLQLFNRRPYSGMLWALKKAWRKQA